MNPNKQSPAAPGFVLLAGVVNPSGPRFLLALKQRPVLKLHLRFFVVVIDVKTNRIDYYITLCSIADLNIKKGDKKEGMRIYATVINEFPDIEQLIAALLKNVAAKRQRSISDMQMETLYKRFILGIAEAKKQ